MVSSLFPEVSELAALQVSLGCRTPAPLGRRGVLRAATTGVSRRRRRSSGTGDAQQGNKRYSYLDVPCPLRHWLLSVFTRVPTLVLSTMIIAAGVRLTLGSYLPDLS